MSMFTKDRTPNLLDPAYFAQCNYQCALSVCRTYTGRAEECDIFHKGQGLHTCGITFAAKSSPDTVLICDISNVYCRAEFVPAYELQQP